jgi:hypothetical protein
VRLPRTVVFSLLLGTLALAASAQADLIGIYRNGMGNKAQLGQIAKLSGKRCGRGGLEGAFGITVGKATKECSYRTPVFGRDLEIAASMRLLASAQVPKSVQRSAFLGLDLRSGGGARYQLAVYPLQRKAQLRKVLASGSIEYLDIEKNVAGVGGVGTPNELRLRAFNATSGDERGNCQILGFVGGKVVVEATDEGAGELEGRASGFSLGSAKVAKGARATVDDVVVRVPSPY